jgi:hypothetical protein
MRLSILFLAMAILLGGAPQEDKKAPPPEEKKEEKKKERFDPFADPTEELMKRAEKSEKEKRFNELKAAAIELKELSAKMSDDIEAGGKDVLSAKMWSNLDRAEKLLKTMREKAK